MRIGVDCRLSGSAHAGIGRYIENLLIRLPTLAPDIEWVFIFSDKKQRDDIFERAEKKYQAGLAAVEITYIPIKHYTIDEQFKLPPLLCDLKLDLLHVPHFNVPLNYPYKMVVTIHDLLWHEYKGTQVTTLNPIWYWLKYLAYRYVASQAIKKAQLVFVPAEMIKKTIKKYYPTIGSKVIVTKEGIDDRLIVGIKNGLERDKNTLIYVGSLYPHKNVRLVIEALTQLPDWKLVIVGARSVFQDEVRLFAEKQGVQQQVEFVGYLNDKELSHRLQTATALVQPSFSEGFGLTGLEALALGTPIIVSNIPIFREIYQHAAIYFDPTSVKSFIRFLKHVKASGEWQKKAKRVVAQYSWDTMVEETIEQYRKTMSADRP
jgi:glycosyltransferase involved in cell wall biosynthesis